jgi:CheY-like chemotaxis protein
MREKVLVADDHIDAADTTALLLRLEGSFEVEVVYGGLEAVNAARTFAPDLVLLDINMPGMDGYQAAGIIRSEQPPNRRLVLVALTGRSTQDDIELARRAGFDYHIAKPAAAETLCALIASFLDQTSVDAP